MEHLTSPSSEQAFLMGLDSLDQKLTTQYNNRALYLLKPTNKLRRASILVTESRFAIPHPCIPIPNQSRSPTNDPSSGQTVRGPHLYSHHRKLRRPRTG